MPPDPSKRRQRSRPGSDSEPAVRPARCPVYLENPRGFLRIRAPHFERLKGLFPGLDFTLCRTLDAFLTELPRAHIAITWQFDVAWYDRSPGLEAIFTPAAGHDWVAEDPRGRTKVVHGRFHGAIMAESLLAMMLYFTRNMGRSLALQKEKTWGDNHLAHTSRLGSHTVLIVGMGAIGERCASLLAPLGCRIIGVRRSTGRPPPPGVERLITPRELAAALPHADHVVAILPATPQTDGFFTRDHFRAMKRSARFYNLGRGNCVRTEDIVWAIEKGEVAGMGLDVFEQEPLPPRSRLWSLPNVFILSHASAMCREYLDLYIDELREELGGFLTRRAGKPAGRESPT